MTDFEKSVQDAMESITEMDPLDMLMHCIPLIVSKAKKNDVVLTYLKRRYKTIEDQDTAIVVTEIILALTEILIDNNRDTYLKEKQDD